MAGQGAKGGGQVAMPAAQAMSGYRGPMGPQGPQGALGGPSIVMPNGMSSGDVNMGGNVSVATGPIDTGLGAEASLVGQRPRITDAMGNPQGSQMFGVFAPIEGTAEAGGALGGTPAIGASGVLGPQQPAPSYNFTYDQAVGRQQQRRMPLGIGGIGHLQRRCRGLVNLRLGYRNGVEHGIRKQSRHHVCIITR